MQNDETRSVFHQPSKNQIDVFISICIKLVFGREEIQIVDHIVRTRRFIKKIQPEINVYVLYYITYIYYIK